jgi:Na+/H+-dicarboxylate symporter
MIFLMLADKGAAGVPRGGLLSLTIALQTFHLPQAGIALILGVDSLFDMGRTAINVLGNAVVTASIASSEGELSRPVVQLARN